MGRYESKSDYVERELQARIQDGTLAAGTPIRQRDIALELGVSHTPVREALSRLRAKGYVSSELHRGTTVVRRVGDRRRENWLVRARLESLAVELALPNMSPRDLDGAATLAREFEISEGGARHAANRRFHFFLYEFAGSPVLLRFLVELWDALDVQPSDFRDHEQSVTDHFQLVELLRAGKGAEAGELLTRHIMHTYERGASDDAEAPGETGSR